MADNSHDSIAKKLEDQLNCVICLDIYTDPKLLQCFHVFCRQCLVKLVVRDQQGQLVLTCPTCRHATPVPANGVAGLQSAFQVNHLLEILEEHKKAKDTAASQEGAKNVVTCPIPLKKVIANCFDHEDKERELYCETCSDLICFKCAIKGGKHINHDYFPLDEAYERYKGEITPSLEPLEKKLEAVKKALTQLDKCSTDLFDQQAAIEANIHDNIGRLHEVLEVRRTELIGQLHEMIERKLKSLAVQKDEIETIQAQLSSCLDFTRESLKTSNQEEVLMMKTNIVNQVKELTAPFPPDALEPTTETDVKFLASSDVTDKCQTYGQIFSSPKCQATGEGLEVAMVGEKSSAVLQVINFKDQSCVESFLSLQCELSSEMTGARLRGSVEKMEQGQYRISYQPTIRGRHQLHIKVEDRHIRGSPFDVMVKLPLEKLGTPIRTIDGVRGPRGVVVNQKGEVVVTEEGKFMVSVFSPDGERLQSFGSRGSGQRQFDQPWGITTDGDGNILVADYGNCCIQKFTASGQFLSAVGRRGNGPLQFNHPMEIAFNTVNKKVYVADEGNDCVQVLNSDLTFFSKFGKRGSGKGQFEGPHGIAYDSTGNIYVADFGNHRIQVFKPEGQFLRTFGKQGHGRGELVYPLGITIDTNDVVYVSEGLSNQCVSVFTSEGHFLTSFGGEGTEPGKFIVPSGLAVDSSGFVYVCDHGNNRVQVF